MPTSYQQFAEVFYWAKSGVVSLFSPNGGACPNLPLPPSHQWRQVDAVMCRFYFPAAGTTSEATAKTKRGQANERLKETRWQIHHPEPTRGKSHACVMHCLFRSSTSLTGWRLQKCCHLHAGDNKKPFCLTGSPSWAFQYMHAVVWSLAPFTRVRLTCTG